MMFIKNTTKSNYTPIEICIGFILVSLPFPFSIINISLAIFIICFIFSKKDLQLKRSLLIPILYFVLCVVSLLYTINQNETLKYLTKAITIFLLPLIFLFIPKFNINQRNNILNIYSYSMVIISIFYLIRAFFRFYQDNNIDHFFYHNLVSLEVNAIYISLFLSVAFIYLINKKEYKSLIFYISNFILLATIILLSSKSIIIITIIATIITLMNGNKSKIKIFTISIITILLIYIPLSYTINNRFQREFINLSNNTTLDNNVISISPMNALTQEKFPENHYFNGTSFRIYQMRNFYEVMDIKHILLGYGPSAIKTLLKENMIKDNLDEYYSELNYHNQFLQTTTTLGLIGLFLLIIMLLNNLQIGIKHKDYIFIYFSIISILIMFTESIFERQRGIVFFITLYCIFNNTKISYLNK